MTKKIKFKFWLLCLLAATPRAGFSVSPKVLSAAAEIVGISYVTGIGMSWIFGAYPRSMDEVPYNAEEQEIMADLEAELKDFPEDADLNYQFGVMQTKHNFIDEAEVHLEKAKDLEPDNALYKVWYASNAAKQAGASWDFTWGLLKLYNLGVATDAINEAVVADPENWEVRLVRLKTFTSVGFSDLLEDTEKDVNWYLQHEKEDPDFLLAAVKQQFYIGISDFYVTKDSTPANLTMAKEYLQKAKTVATVSPSTQSSIDSIESKF